MKQILVPTDFSECAASAIAVAKFIAEKTGAQLDLLHLLDSPAFMHLSRAGAAEVPEEVKKEKGEAQQKLNDLKTSISKAGVKVQTFLGMEATTQQITNHAEKHESDLIVMGSHGSSGFKEAFLGSNTQKILRRSKAPVLVVKEVPQPLKFDNIVFASTFRKDVHQAFEKILKMAELMGANIHLLYVNMPYNFEVSSNSMGRMQEFAQNYPGHDFAMHIYNAFDEESGILKFSHEYEIDLIATTTHGKSGFIQMLSPSITESLANHSSLPVLSVNVK